MSADVFSEFSLEHRSVLLAANAMDSTLLITGPTGTGKSRLAELVHRHSPRRCHARFHKINLATLSENLIESELFGHERGAFTGAENRRLGRLEVCNGGTVLLDEIGELTPRLQAKLLDFIQHRRISPVGSNKEIEVDARIIAATNRDLEAAVAQGLFREDLYHRLKVFHVALPGLIEEPGRALPLAREALADFAARFGRGALSFAADAEDVLARYPWPGNVRELRNAMEYAVALESTDVVRLRSLPRSLQKWAEGNPAPDCGGSPTGAEQEPPEGAGAAAGTIEMPVELNFYAAREAFEKRYLEHVLRLHGGQINITSRRIGLNKVSLGDKLRRYDIDWRKLKNLTSG